MGKPACWIPGQRTNAGARRGIWPTTRLRSRGRRGTFGSSPPEGFGDGGRGSYIEDDDVRVVVVRIRGGRISDWKGAVKDWIISDDSDERPVVNGGPES